MRMKWAENKHANGNFMVNLEENDSKLIRNIDIFYHCDSLASRVEKITNLQIFAFCNAL
jgi:hypothetical protein